MNMRNTNALFQLCLNAFDGISVLNTILPFFFTVINRSTSIAIFRQFVIARQFISTNRRLWRNFRYNMRFKRLSSHIGHYFNPLHSNIPMIVVFPGAPRPRLPTDCLPPIIDSSISMGTLSGLYPSILSMYLRIS